jgi:peptidyl-prolyl cis-trans isomerase SurA
VQAASCVPDGASLRFASMSRLRLLAPFCALLALAVTSHAAAPILVNGVAAVANDSIITFEEVQIFTRRPMEAVARRARNQAEFDQEAVKIQRDGLEQLIERRLIVGEFKTAGFQLPEAIVDELVRDRVRKDFGDRVTLTKMLRQSGQTSEGFRQEERDALIVYQMVRKNVSEEIVVSPRKIERWYGQHQDKFQVGNRVKVRMILIDARKHARGEPVQIAKEALAKIQGGADFAQVANEFSDDARSNKGGDRGWIENKEAGGIRKELRDEAFKLKAGEVSGVIDLDGTAFIIKVEERQEAQVRPLSEVRGEIETTLKQEERDRLQKAWVARLRRKSFIRYY